MSVVILPGRLRNGGMAVEPSPDPLDDGSDTLPVSFFMLLNPGAMMIAVIYLADYLAWCKGVDNECKT